MNIFKNPEYASLRVILAIVAVVGIGYFAVGAMRTSSLEQTGRVIEGKTAILKTLQLGVKSNAEVKSLQQFLTSKKYFAGKVDGTFGVDTQDAVKKFQAANGFKQTGIFGGKWEWEDLSRMPPPPPPEDAPVPCDVDLNNDGIISVLDFNIFMASFGASGNDIEADFTGDGLVGAADLAVLVGFYGSAATNCQQEFIKVSLGGQHGCGISATNKLYCWGQNSLGQLGNGMIADNLTPVVVDMTNAGVENTFKSVSAGMQHTCAIHTNNKLYCWGANYVHQLGTNTPPDQSILSPKLIDTSFDDQEFPIEIQNSFKQVSSGEQHTCAIHTNNKLYCWGSGLGGQLGNNTFVNSPMLQAVDMSSLGIFNSFTDVSAGFVENTGENLYSNTTCAIHTNGKLYCWGMDFLGLLGNGEASDTVSATPITVDVVDNSFVDVSIAYSHACAVHSNGKIYCWGRRIPPAGVPDSGELIHSPTVISTADGLSDSFTKISAGLNQTCALHTNGGAYCFGYGSALGIGDVDEAYISPIAPDLAVIDAENIFTSINDNSAGSVCAINADSKTYCWGSNFFGQFGNGTTSTDGFPAQVDTSNVF